MNASPALKSLPGTIASTEELIEEARAGRMFILVDDEDRENEGDIIIPAQFATPQALAFMMRHARGLICLTMTQSRVEHLQLPMMAVANQQRHQTAFTVSIEAKDGITTGVSARDRAHTIAMAINPDTTPKDLVTPGYVFPLAAKPGGTVAIEDVDFGGAFSYPPSQDFERYLGWYDALTRRNGGNPNLGRELFAMVSELGVSGVEVATAQPAFAAAPGKDLAVTTLEHIGQELVARGLASASELEATLAGLRTYAAAPTTVLSMPRVFQVWGRVT